MKNLLLAAVAALALSTSANAAVIQNLGVNPSSAQGQFSNGVDGLAFTDQYTFQLVGSPLFITFASATNVFAAPSDFITSFTGQLFLQVGAVGLGGGADIPVSPLVAAVPCQQNPTGCQILAGSALLGAGNYYLQLMGIGGGTAGYGGNLTTAATGNNTPGQTPVPGAMLLMGSVLAGAAGFAGWRKQRSKRDSAAPVA